MSRWIAVLVLAVALSSCKREEGGACPAQGEAVCDENGRMLVCVDGRWSAIACGGPKGCSASGRFVDCDETRAAERDPCGRDGEGNATCSHDGKQSLECREGQWRVRESCPGPAGCTVSGDNRWVDCDGALIVDEP